jgi:hypothetical protein
MDFEIGVHGKTRRALGSAWFIEMYIAVAGLHFLNFSRPSIFKILAGLYFN